MMLVGVSIPIGNKTWEGVNMVHFSKNGNEMLGSFTFSVEGDNEDYVNTLVSLLNLVSGQNEDNLNYKDIAYVNQLIISMLPDPDQIINKEFTSQ